MSQANSLNVEMTLTIEQSTGGQTQSIEHLITSMCQFFETPWHNFKTKLLWQLNQSKIFKVRILEFRAIVDEKNSHIKIPKPQIQTSWICWLAEFLWGHLLLLFNNETHLIFYTVPKTNIKVLQHCFITCNFHTILLCINKNVEKDYQSYVGFNNPIVLLLSNQSPVSSNQSLDVAMGWEKKLERNLTYKMPIQTYATIHLKTQIEKNQKKKNRKKNNQEQENLPSWWVNVAILLCNLKHEQGKHINKCFHDLFNLDMQWTLLFQNHKITTIHQMHFLVRVQHVC